MKKLLLVLSVILLVAASCNSSSPIQTTQQQSAQTAQKTKTPASSTTPNTPPSADEIGDISVSANPSAITLGQQVQIQWSSKGATSCTMTESDAAGKASDVSASKGGVYRTPTTIGKITYTIACKDAVGTSKTLSANVTVNAAVTPSPTQSAAITLSITSNPTAGGNVPVTAGATNTKLVSYTFRNPTSQSVSVGQFYLNVMASSGSNAFTIENFKALVNGSLFTNGQASHPEKTNYLVNFMGNSNNSLVIPAKGQIIVEIYGDISSLPVGTSGTLSLVTCTNGYDLTFNSCANAPQAINLVVAQ